MYIWRKRAGARWLQARGERNDAAVRHALAVVERPGSERALLEICCRTKQEAQDLIREFGGSTEKLQPGWLQHFAKQARGKPLRIGSRLVILGERPKGGAPRANSRYSGRGRFRHGPARHHGDVLAVPGTDNPSFSAGVDDARCRHGQRHSGHRRQLFRCEPSARDR